MLSAAAYVAYVGGRQGWSALVLPGGQAAGRWRYSRVWRRYGGRSMGGGSIASATRLWAGTAIWSYQEGGGHIAWREGDMEAGRSQVAFFRQIASLAAL